MSTESKINISKTLDTSHLKVKFPFKEKYGNFIGGKFVKPKSGKYFDNVSPINNEVICSIARSDASDVEAALDSAHAAFPAWGVTSITERSNLLLKIADVIEKNLELLATAECLDNGKPIRECMAADLPLVVDHWRYFAGVIRAEEGSVSEISNSEYSYHIPEPLGVVAQIIPWNFPLLMGPNFAGGTPYEGPQGSAKKNARPTKACIVDPPCTCSKHVSAETGLGPLLTALRC